MPRYRLPNSAWLLAAAALLSTPMTAVEAKKKKQAEPEVSVTVLAGFPQGVAVHEYYKRWRGPHWFEDNGAAVTQLIEILRRSHLDGLLQGASLADQVESAARQAASKNRADVATAEQILSAAWVTYVEALRRPTKDMIYGYASLVPQPPRVDQVLSAATSAPSLAQHLAQVSAVNPLYASLRDAAWAEMKANPGMTPDPRIALNLDRLRSMPQTNRFVLVNIAGQTLTMYENGQPVDSMRVVVGNREFPTPMISSIIYYATFNPYWNVPEHLVRRTVAPNVVRTGAAYLSARGYQVMADWSVDAATLSPASIDWQSVASGRKNVRIRQLPNASNSMGKIKFSFENGEGIFLHDTPTREYFARADRALSNGCVRLQDAARFGRWLLQRDAVAPSSAPEQNVQLPVGVPVYLTYLTAQEADGKITYLRDIYGWDSGGSFQPLGVSSSLAR